MAKGIRELKDGVELLGEFVKSLNRSRADMRRAGIQKLQLLGYKRTLTGFESDTDLTVHGRDTGIFSMGEERKFDIDKNINGANRIIRGELKFYDETYKQITEAAQHLISSLKEMREKYGLRGQVSTNPLTTDLFKFLTRLKRIRDPFITIKNSLKRQEILTDQISRWNPSYFEQAYREQINSQKEIASTVKREYEFLTESIRMKSTVKSIDETLKKLREEGVEESDYVFGVMLKCMFYMAGGMVGLSMLAPETQATFNEIASRGPDMVKGVTGAITSLAAFGAAIYPAITYLKKENRLARKRERIIHRLAKIKA